MVSLLPPMYALSVSAINRLMDIDGLADDEICIQGFIYTSRYYYVSDQLKNLDHFKAYHAVQYTCQLEIMKCIILLYKPS